jgi:methyl-accepting chemotaxis protein
MKRKLFLLVIIMVAGLVLITSIVYLQTKSLHRTLAVDSQLSQEMHEKVMMLTYKIQKLESVISYAFLSRLKVDVESSIKNSDELLKSIGSEITSLRSDKYDAFSDHVVTYQFEDKENSKTYQQLTLDLEKNFLDLKNRIATLLQNRGSFLDAQESLEKKRNLLSKQFRGMMDFKDIHQDGFSALSRSVLTVLSTNSVRDLNFAGRGVFEDAVKTFDGTTLKDEHKEKWEKLKANFNETFDLASKVGASSNDYELMQKEIQHQIILTEAFSKFSSELFNKGQDGAIQTASNTGKYTLFFSLIIVLACLVFGYFITQGLLNTISRIVNHLGEAGTEVSGTGEHLKNTSGSLSNGATRSAASLEETVSSLTEISSMVARNTEKSIECANLSVSASTVVQEGQKQVKDLINSMHELASSSIKISEIATVIEDIAFQTNLLALNAAVEAARAGEQGKGFAVVADAVRSLAQRSAVAAKDISTITNDGLAKTQESVIKADKSDVALRKIVDSIEKLTLFSKDIAESSQQQASGIEQVNRALNELDEVSQKNAASAEETAQSSASLSTQAINLTNLVQDLRDLVGQEKEAS